jgi:hypothetical protein
MKKALIIGVIVVVVSMLIWACYAYRKKQLKKSTATVAPDKTKLVTTLVDDPSTDWNKVKPILSTPEKLENLKTYVANCKLPKSYGGWEWDMVNKKAEAASKKVTLNQLLIMDMAWQNLAEQKTAIGGGTTLSSKDQLTVITADEYNKIVKLFYNPIK